MSGNTDNGKPRFLVYFDRVKRLKEWLGGVVYIVSTAVGFFLWADDHLTLLVAVSAGILCCCLIYIVISKKAIGAEITDRPLLRERFSPSIRWAAMGGLVILGLLSSGYFGYMLYRYVINSSSSSYVILVADIDGPDETYGVTESTLTRLRRATSEYDSVEVKPLGKTITVQEGSDVARAKAEEHEANICPLGMVPSPF